jgi:hypothetical protein
LKKQYRAAVDFKKIKYEDKNKNKPAKHYTLCTLATHKGGFIKHLLSGTNGNHYSNTTIYKQYTIFWELNN